MLRRIQPCLRPPRAREPASPICERRLRVLQSAASEAFERRRGQCPNLVSEPADQRAKENCRQKAGPLNGALPKIALYRHLDDAIRRRRLGREPITPHRALRNDQQ